MAEAAACRIHSSLILDFLVVRIDYAVVMAAVVRCTAVIGLALLRGSLLNKLSSADAVVELAVPVEVGTVLEFGITVFPQPRGNGFSR